VLNETKDVDSRQLERATVKSDTFRTPPSKIINALHVDNDEQLLKAIESISCWEHHGKIEKGKFKHFQDTLSQSECPLCSKGWFLHSRQTSANCSMHCSKWIQENKDVVFHVRKRMYNYGYTSNEISDFLLRQQRMWGKSGQHSNAQMVYFLPSLDFISSCVSNSVEWSWAEARSDSPNWRRVCQNMFAFATGIPQSRFTSVANLRRKGASSIGKKDVPFALSQGQKKRTVDVKVCCFFLFYNLFCFKLIHSCKLK
jgi:hypothetical protein